MHLPLCAPSRCVLDGAQQDAQAREHLQTDTGHLLMGLLQEPDGVASPALGLTTYRAREGVARHLAG